MWLLCSVIDINRIFIFFLNEITEGERLDGGNLLSMLTGSGKEVSGTGLLGGTLEVDLDSGLGGLSLGSLVGNLAGKDLLLALGLADVLDADVDALLKDAAIDEITASLVNFRDTLSAATSGVHNALKATRAAVRLRTADASPEQQSFPMFACDELISDRLDGIATVPLFVNFADARAAVEGAGLVFIGPTSDTIAAMGDKTEARRRMADSDVPIVPGLTDAVADADEAEKKATEIGYPVLLKASAGGGGKGMRVVEKPEDLTRAFEAASREALAAFGDGSVYIERYLARPRHIEIQVLGDAHGNIVHLGERECSIQRRHQKLVEEAPSSVLTEEERTAMGQAAVRAAEAVGYRGAGTIEFLLDFNGSYYFMEMNTRIQVEHPVTEMVLGVDLIKYQIMCHSNYQLPSWMHSLKPRGHAIECRINAENPSKNFMPSPGTITSFHMPGGMNIRVDTHVYAGYKVPSNYDSMIAKLIVHGLNREDAINKMIAALDEFVIEGIDTIIPYHKQILNDNDFNNGNFDTSFIEHFEYVKEYNNEST